MGNRKPWIFVGGIAGLLLVSGVVHGLWGVVTGSDFAGAVSIRKPALFGLSAGVTVLSIHWVLGLVRARRFDGVWDRIFAGAMFIEVGLITLQFWRGVPSHFNRATILDASILNLLEALILLATLMMIQLTIRSLGPLRCEPAMGLSIRAGMIFLVLSCLFGIWMVSYGNGRVAAGLDPSTYGTAGVMKFPHGIAIHAIQIFPLAVWLLRRLGFSEFQRYSAIKCAVVVMSSMAGYSLVQTLAGEARWDVIWGSVPFLVLAVVATVWGAIRLLPHGRPVRV